MAKGTLKYLIILVLAVTFTFVLTYYIINSNKVVKNDVKVTENVQEIKTENKKDYILTRKMDITLNDKDYKFNLKFYGETLSDKKKIITTEVYIGEYFKGEYIYINNAVSTNNYDKIIKEYDELNNSKNALYIIGNNIVLELSKYDETKKSTLIMFNEKEIIKDIMEINYIDKCRTESIGSYLVKEINYEESSFIYYKANEEKTMLEEYKITSNEEGLISTLSNSYIYGDYCI